MNVRSAVSELSKAAKLTALGTLVVAGGAIGGVVATSGATPQHQAVRIVQRADSATPTTDPATTAPPPAAPAPAPAPTPTTLTPQDAATSANQSAQAAAQSATQAQASANSAAQSASQAQAAAPTTTTQPPNVTVPNVAGMSWNDANATIMAAGLRGTWSSACPVDPSGPELLIGTVPAAGTAVPKGTTINFCNVKSP